MSDRNVVLYIAMSLDGYIATKEDDISWLSQVEVDGEDYGYAKFIDRIDTVIMGRKTYDKVCSFGIEFPHKDKKCYIISRKKKESNGVEYYSGDIKKLIEELKNKDGKDIFVDGGAEVVNEILRENLFDEYIISIIPILLGDGKRLFQDGRPTKEVLYVGSKSYFSGLVQVHYKNK
ncbi:dihydrofolate reductase family protein [Clostridium sp. 'White wine YQ']|uniref:dihydrofolate reductase family protein n=1 Tax=Clostridium sp. 'White wine YQ' TaxID=3027474 RepID=UPI002366E2B7|nr:dihydrofolate reductase family protein [Clostridium sp. 'White wine YQ']MDD7792898.1 dihydrofolate reductase family protein [Clostridium sp. 'White wine YQ']